MNMLEPQKPEVTFTAAEQASGRWKVIVNVPGFGTYPFNGGGDFDEKQATFVAACLRSAYQMGERRVQDAIRIAIGVGQICDF